MTTLIESLIIDVIRNSEPRKVWYLVAESSLDSLGYLQNLKRTRSLVTAYQQLLTSAIRESLRASWSEQTKPMTQWTARQLWDMTRAVVPVAYSEDYIADEFHVATASALLMPNRMEELLMELSSQTEVEQLREYFMLTEHHEAILIDRGIHERIIKAKIDVYGQYEVDVRGIYALDWVLDTASRALTIANLLSVKSTELEWTFSIEIDSRVCSQLSVEFPVRLVQMLTVLGELAWIDRSPDDPALSRLVLDLFERHFPKFRFYKRTQQEEKMFESIDYDGIDAIRRVAYWLVSQYSCALIQRMFEVRTGEVRFVPDDRVSIFDSEIKEYTREGEVRKRIKEVMLCMFTTVPEDVDRLICARIMDLDYPGNVPVVLNTDASYIPEKSWFVDPNVLGAVQPQYVSNVVSEIEVKVAQRTWDDMIASRSGAIISSVPVFVQIVSKEHTEWNVTWSYGVPAKHRPPNRNMLQYQVEELRTYGPSRFDKAGCPRAWELSKGPVYCFVPPEDISYLIWITFWKDDEWIAIPILDWTMDLRCITHVEFKSDICVSNAWGMRFDRGRLMSWVDLWDKIDAAESVPLLRDNEGMSEEFLASAYGWAHRLD